MVHAGEFETPNVREEGIAFVSNGSSPASFSHQPGSFCPGRGAVTATAAAAVGSGALSPASPQAGHGPGLFPI